MSLTFIEVFVTVLSLTLVYYLTKGKKHGNLPPGPKTIPILGNLHMMGKKPHLMFTELRAKFGDIYSFQFGSYPGIVLNGHKVIREALSDGPFNGRHLKTAAFRREGGIVLNEGKGWAEQRRFTLKTLRDFGFGKKSVESLIADEVQEIIERLRKSLGKPNDLQMIFNAAVLNTLWNMMAGERFSHDDPKLVKLIGLLNTTFQGSSLTVLDKLSFFVSLLHPLRDFLPKSKGMQTFFSETVKLMKEVVQKHKETYDPEQVRDFIDAYLKEIENATEENSTFYKDQGEHNLSIVLFELFIAGTETTASTLTYTLQYLAKYPEVQERVFEEINRVVGLTRQPVLADRPNLPYTEATMYESMRLSTLLPGSLIHKTTEDVSFHGYFIPKETIVIPNLHSAMSDPAVWGDPQNFRPERFITAEGTLLKHHEALLPFSVGKRVCLGETLARDQFFLFLSSLVQQFRFKPDPKLLNFEIEYFVTPLILPPAPKPLILEDRLFGNAEK